MNDASDFRSGPRAGPELGPGQWHSFRVRACHHGDGPDFARFEVEATAQVAPLDGVPPGFAVSVDGAFASADASGPVPSTRSSRPGGFYLGAWTRV